MQLTTPTPEYLTISSVHAAQRVLNAAAQEPTKLPEQLLQRLDFDLCHTLCRQLDFLPLRALADGLFLPRRLEMLIPV
jgi:hypothetical protein